MVVFVVGAISLIRIIVKLSRELIPQMLVELHLVIGDKGVIRSSLEQLGEVDFVVLTNFVRVEKTVRIVRAGASIRVQGVQVIISDGEPNQTPPIKGVGVGVLDGDSYYSVGVSAFLVSLMLGFRLDSFKRDWDNQVSTPIN